MRIHLVLVALSGLASISNAQTFLQDYTGAIHWKTASAVHMAADQNGDGYPDVLVSSPGANSGQGNVSCVSGKWLATSVLPATLWTLQPSMPNAAGFGASIIEVATLTGNSATDFLISAPDYKAGFFATGALFLVDGSTHTIAATMVGFPNTRAGTSLAAVGDQDGDGKIDIATTAPSTNGSASHVHVIRGSSFGVAGSIAASVHSSLNSNGDPAFGAVVASGFDLDHDGRFDLAIGSPDFLGNGMLNIVRADGQFTFLASHVGQTTGERFGASIDGTRDFDGDGRVDFVVGSPNWSAPGSSQNGRVSVLSGTKLLASSFPFDLFTLQWAPASAGPSGSHFGAAVRATPDLTADGVPDLIVGAPGVWSPIPPLLDRGGFAVFSGATATRVAGLVGDADDRLGDVILDGVLDLNADGRPDIGVAASQSDNPTTDCGSVSFYSIFPGTVQAYCTAKTNSAGCAPAMSWNGVPDVDSSSPFTVTCTQLLNQKVGLFMYSHLPNAKPFQGGTLCVKGPLKRTDAASTGGSASGIDCTGSLAFDFNAHIQSGADPTLTVGAEVFTQVWSRDAASSSGSSLSNALKFMINP